jgi:hypothetical protein
MEVRVALREGQTILGVMDTTSTVVSSGFEVNTNPSVQRGRN